MRVATSWPELALSSWSETRDTLHMWTQVVGKVRLALEPMINHWWQVPLYVSARGLTTTLMHAGDTGLELEFDFLDHQLSIRTSRDQQRSVALRPRSVADFYDATMAALRELEVSVSVRPKPVEVEKSIPFPEDFTHSAYDGAAAHRFWQTLVQIDRVFKRFRSGFVGKVSPVHFFWGGFDLAVTRFSGRAAPKHRGGVPNCADWVMVEAYSHEVSSAGFWPGGSAEGSFYSYAYPEPEGFSNWKVAPRDSYYDTTLREFILPYEAVRRSENPESTLLTFLESTYEAAAVLGRWDRESLEATRAR